MASSSGTGMVDPTKPSKYPVILSDELLGKTSREMFTGVRYNHRPTDEAPSTARIKASTPGSGTFDLAFHDAEGSKYGFNGRRAADENQFVLVFEPARKAFVLHRLDSLFNMNLVSTPTNDDAASLKEEYPHLTGHGIPTPARGAQKARPKPAASSALRNTKKKAPAAETATKAIKKKEPANRKQTAGQKKQQQPTEPLALPDVDADADADADLEPEPPSKKKTAQPPPPPVAREDDDDDDEEEDSDDGGLLIEYPGGKGPNPRANNFSPAFQPFVPRDFSKFVQGNGAAEEDEDADAEADDDDFVDATAEAEPEPLNLASPANDALDLEDLEDDLENVLEAELLQQQEVEVEDDDASEISEED